VFSVENKTNLGEKAAGNVFVERRPAGEICYLFALYYLVKDFVKMFGHF